MATVVLRRPNQVFVGRQDLIESYHKAFGTDRATIADACGVIGSGKTTLLSRLRNELAGTPQTLVLEIELGESDARSPSELEATSEALEEAFARYREIVGSLSRQCAGVVGRMEAVEEALDIAHNRMSPELKVRSVRILSKSIESPGAIIELTEEGYKGMVRENRWSVANAFAEDLGRKLGGRHTLLTIDGFDCVAATDLGEWLLDLARRLEHTLTVIARTPGDVLSGFAGANLIKWRLDPLTKSEIRDLLQECLPRDVISQDLVDVVESFSAGHAQTVGLAAELLERLDDCERKAAAFERRLANLPEDLARKNAAMVSAVLAHDGPEMTELVQACCVPRRFDAELLEAVLPHRHGTGQQMIEQLDAYSFIEPVQDPRGGFFRVHEFVRAPLNQEFAAEDPITYAKRHHAAAEHIAKWLNDYQEAACDPKSYGSWYRYEQPDWQAAIREWLYHQAKGASGPAGAQERELGRLRFAHIILDAFWWWGCYREFPFIGSLLDDWRATQQDVDWIEDLDTFVRAYPTGYLKDPDPQSWEQVLRALLEVRDACGVPGPVGALNNEEQRHVRGLLDVFMAHSYRFRRADDRQLDEQLLDRAKKCYREAAELFEKDKDDWSVAWTLFEMSDLAVEHGHLPTRQDWQRVAKLLPSLGDDELAANMHRLAADILWSRWPLKALAAHGRAILFAYMLQGRYQRKRYRPDAYTLDFYTEHVERATKRLIEYASHKRDLARAWAGLLESLPKVEAVKVEQLAAWCKGGDRAQIAHYFPVPPQPDDLGRQKSAFLVRWKEQVLQMGEPETSIHGSAW